MLSLSRGMSFRYATEEHDIPIATLHRYFKKMNENSESQSIYTIRKTISDATTKNFLLTPTEEAST